MWELEIKKKGIKIEKEEEIGIKLPTPTKIEARFASPVLKNGVILYKNVILGVSKEYDVSESLIKAIITQESMWDKVAKEPINNPKSYGLMQVTEGASKDVDLYKEFLNDEFKPTTNIEIGTAYYAHLRKTYYEDTNSGEDLKKITLAAYNCGLGNIAKICQDNLWDSCTKKGFDEHCSKNDVPQYISNILAYEKEFNKEEFPKERFK